MPGQALPTRDGVEDSEKIQLFSEELKGWKGYIEWEKYPDKKKKAAEILAKHEFAKVDLSNSASRR